MDENWQQAEKVQTNDQGEFRALIGQNWIPVQKAQINDQGQFRVLLPSQGEIPKGRMLQSAPRTLAFGGQFQRADVSKDPSANLDPYEFGGGVTDATGSPLAGTAARLLPELAMGLGGGGVGVKAAPVVANAARRTMQIAVNPASQDLMSGAAGRAIDTMLKKDIPLSAESMKLLRLQIEELAKQTAAKIEPLAENISVGKVGESLAPVFDRFVRAGNKGDIGAIKKAWAEFRNHPLIRGQEEIPIQTAQSIKTAKGSMLDTRAYGELGTAETAAEKSLVHGLKTQIAEKAPEVIPMNQLQSELRNVVSVSERKALMELSRSPANMAFLFHSPEAYAAYTLGKSKTFGSALSRMLFRNQESLPAGAGAIAGALPDAYQSQFK